MHELVCGAGSYQNAENSTSWKSFRQRTYVPVAPGFVAGLDAPDVVDEWPVALIAMKKRITFGFWSLKVYNKKQYYKLDYYLPIEDWLDEVVGSDSSVSFNFSTCKM